MLHIEVGKTGSRQNCFLAIAIVNVLGRLVVSSGDAGALRGITGWLLDPGGATFPPGSRPQTDGVPREMGHRWVYRLSGMPEVRGCRVSSMTGKKASITLKVLTTSGRPLVFPVITPPVVAGNGDSKPLCIPVAFHAAPPQALAIPGEW